MVERNLRRVHGADYPDAAVRRDVQRVFDSYARYWLDSLRLPSLDARRGGPTGSPTTTWTTCSSPGPRASAPILALPHLGGWEWAAALARHRPGQAVAAVVEQLEPPELVRVVPRLPSGPRHAHHPVGPERGQPSVAQRSRRATIMCLLCDRDITGDGIEVEFFGERTRLPGRTGA